MKPIPESADGLQTIRPTAVFFTVFLCSLLFHLYVSLHIRMHVDRWIWADQIRFFVEKNPKVFDFFYAYGHPGTTLIEIGTLLHAAGTSYATAIIASTSLLVSAGTAGCATICLKLRPRSLWWVSATFTLTFSRLYTFSTPPTAAVLPLIALIVVSAIWLLEQPPPLPSSLFLLHGAILGISGATRLDISCFVGIPLLLLLGRKFGPATAAKITGMAAAAMVACDPFFWFMPVQHSADLIKKFTLHYTHFAKPVPITAIEWWQTVPLAVTAVAVAVFALLRGGKGMLHRDVILTFVCLSSLSLFLLLTSSYQAVRYLYPIVGAWEFLLPQLLETIFPGGGDGDGEGNRNASIRILFGFVIPVQLLGFLLMFPPV